MSEAQVFTYFRPPGTYHYTVSAPGYNTVEDDVTLVDEDVTIDVVMQPTTVNPGQTDTDNDFDLSKIGVGIGAAAIAILVIVAILNLRKPVGDRT